MIRNRLSAKLLFTHWNAGLLLLLLLLSSGCYVLRPSSGGGQSRWAPPRSPDPTDVALPQGYKIEVVAQGLTFPTGVAFDSDGTPVVVESGYAYGEDWTVPRLLRIEPDGSFREIARGSTNGPWTGLIAHGGGYFVAEGGVLGGGRILHITPQGAVRTVVSDMPSFGDHHSNGPILGPDGWLYFGQGTASNSGIVGQDNADFGWLRRYPQFHDIPGQDIVLAGQNFKSKNVLDPNGRGKVQTGAFLPFGTPSTAGQVIKGQVPCSGAILRVRPEGGPVELVAWGLRNPFGLAFAPEGGLYVTENGYDERGSRPVWGTPDVLWKIEPGVWYGWPDFAGGLPLESKAFKAPFKPQPRFLLAKHPNPPPRPAARFGVHSSANGLDFSRNPAFGHSGEAFVALFGDQAPAVGKVLHPVGFKVVRVDVTTGVIHDFAANRGRKNGPASRIGGGGFERPVAVRFNPTGDVLYVVDFGTLTVPNKSKNVPWRQTGVLWRIRRS